MSNEDPLLAAWGVTRQEIEQLDPTDSWANARAQVDAEREAFREWYTTCMEDFASRHGLAFKVEPILKRPSEREGER